MRDILRNNLSELFLSDPNLFVRSVYENTANKKVKSFIHDRFPLPLKGSSGEISISIKDKINLSQESAQLLSMRYVELLFIGMPEIDSALCVYKYQSRKQWPLMLNRAIISYQPKDDIYLSTCLVAKEIYRLIRNTNKKEFTNDELKSILKKSGVIFDHKDKDIVLKKISEIFILKTRRAIVENRKQTIYRIEKKITKTYLSQLINEAI